ncbi:hypothetical protein BH10BAC1_BH10BAC1_02580 [soil metagenome]
MKKLKLSIVAIVIAFNGIAQNVKIVNAKNYLRDFSESKDIESLNKAKENIDLAAVHPDTKDQAKTQTLKAQVYLTIFDNNLRLETEKLTVIGKTKADIIKQFGQPQKTTTTTNVEGATELLEYPNFYFYIGAKGTVVSASEISNGNKSEFSPSKINLMAYQAASSAPLAEAFVACTASKTLDTKGNYTSEVANYIRSIAGHYENKAIADYNAKKYADALPSFEKAYEINGEKDTTTLSNCALVADRAAIYDKAKMYYQKMIDNKQGKGNTYSSLVNVCLMMKDSVTAMEILKKGRTAYPNDINLVITETNYFLKINNSKEALNNLNIALAAKPTDANLFLVRGNIYDNLANPKDEAGKDMEKPKNYDELMKSAEADYKKAIELKPDYFDALYNLGVLYNNHGVVLSKVADQITDNAKYKVANDLASAEFNKALPVLEKALEISPKDRNTMYALKQIYARTQQPEKVKEINERLKNN